MLNEKLKISRSSNPDVLNLRIHRAISWLEQAECTEDLDGKFIYYWIAFNAVYAQDFGNGMKAIDKGLFVQFIHKLCLLDNNKTIYQLVWKTYSGSIRILLNNRFTFQPFWDYQNGLLEKQGWEAQFEINIKRATKALSEQDTPTILTILFYHIYTLRNQIVHGGATHGSSINRDQVGDACNILGSILPVIISIMLEHPIEQQWGRPFYPVIKE
ncbi:hypothetical protein E0H87_04725 [Acinetobacter sp. ANC 4178]|nr:hypothetical protein E0H87_04725 [Acinetobacter sp. ANC 4178]